MKKYFLSVSFVLAVVAFAMFSRDTHTTKAIEISKFVINLPPLELVKPAQLWIAGEKFNFTNGNFVRVPTGKQDLTVTAQRIDLDGVTNRYLDRHDYFEVTITGFALGGGGLAKIINNFEKNFVASASAGAVPPAGIVCILVRCGGYPYEFKMTFTEPTRTVAMNFSTYLRDLTMNDTSRVYLSDRSCSSVDTGAGTTLCIKTTAQLTATEVAPAKHTMTHALPVFGGISVEGNVVGTGTISGFTFDQNSQKSIAIGGTISVTGGAGNNPQNYTQNATKLQWGSENQSTSVSGKIKALYDANLTKATISNSSSFTDGSIFLNSKSNNLRTNESTTLSSPPEGKLWRVGGNLTLENVTVNGSGTIMVDGNLLVKTSLVCAPNTRLGIIATGSITFQLSSTAGRVGCGAYVARGGDILFSSTFSDPAAVYAAKGIFISSGSMKLPIIADDVAFSVKYDSGFASNPTILFKELLNIAFTTLS